MNRLFLCMTLGKDPHTVGIYKAGRIAGMVGISFKILPTDLDDIEKIKYILQLKPEFLGLSYRLSPQNAVNELKHFFQLMDKYGVFNHCENTKICFAGLMPSLKEVRISGIDRKFKLSLMGSYDDVRRTTQQTLDFFNVKSEKKSKEVIDIIVRESEPKRIKILDELAEDIVKEEKYLLEPPLPKPSYEAKLSMVKRIDESNIPVIRSHFGIPDQTIYPTVEGIKKIAEAGAVDELSLGSSDLSQRYYGNPLIFKKLKNDGGVPYKNRADLEILFEASRRGNFPSMKPYCHVKNIIPFIDECLDIGLLKGAHQAIPLFWFDELDGRGDMSVPEAIREHLQAVAYLAQKGIPVEMNDPNQWASRYVHDTLFVTSYALVASILYRYNVENMVFQCQFNKPATTGDYADLAKMTAAKEIIEKIRPRGNHSRMILETRAGIEHFSTDQEVAKFQLARTTLLQMILNPDIVHLVSFCEADHVATAEDVILSSKILRYAIRVFRKNEYDIRKAVEDDIVFKRKAFLQDEVETVLRNLVDIEKKQWDIDIKEMYKILSNEKLLCDALKYKIMSAPGITNKKYMNPEIITKVGENGFIDCYRSWEDRILLTEQERIGSIRRKEGI